MNKSKNKNRNGRFRPPPPSCLPCLASISAHCMGDLHDLCRFHLEEAHQETLSKYWFIRRSLSSMNEVNFDHHRQRLFPLMARLEMIVELKAKAEIKRSKIR